MRDVDVAAPLLCGVPMMHQHMRCTADPAACLAQTLPAAAPGPAQLSCNNSRTRPGDHQLVWLQADASDLQQEDSDDSWPAGASLTGMHVDDVTRTAQMITRQVVFTLA